MLVAPMFAALADLLMFLLPCVVVIIVLLNQVLSRIGQANARRPPQPRRPDLAQNPPPANVNDEIEAFLKKASQQRNQTQTRTTQPPQRPTAAHSPPRPTPARSELAPRRPIRTEPVAAELLDQGPGESVANHVQRHLDTREFDQRTAQLVKVDNADELMEGHLHRVFDHQVGTLSSAHQAIKPTPPPPTQKVQPAQASGFVAMLRDARNLRQAIILQEILNRPENRW